MGIYFEDHVPGSVYQFGSIPVEEKEMLDFARRSQSKPDRGIVKGLVEVLSQTGEIVATWKGTNIVLCRNASPSVPLR